MCRLGSDARSICTFRNCQLSQLRVMEAELFVPARAIGFVQRGGRVRLLYDAFPFNASGVQRDHRAQSPRSPCAARPTSQNRSLKEPAYKVRVALDRQSVDANGRLVPQSDMTLAADIILERRQLIEWLFEPLLSAWKRGLNRTDRQRICSIYPGSARLSLLRQTEVAECGLRVLRWC